MLILTRNVTQSIIINDNIVITILETQGCQVRIGISAPLDVPVHREEIYNKIREERGDEPIDLPKIQYKHPRRSWKE